MVASGPLPPPPLDRASLHFHSESCPIPPPPRGRACAEGGLNTRYL